MLDHTNPSTKSSSVIVTTKQRVNKIAQRARLELDTLFTGGSLSVSSCVTHLGGAGAAGACLTDPTPGLAIIILFNTSCLVSITLGLTAATGRFLGSDVPVSSLFIRSMSVALI
jgi:hypothetical protein